MWQTWLATVLQDPRYFALLLDFDLDLLREAWSEPCRHCGKRLDRGDYERKPRGQPEGKLPEGFCTRFSLCCSACRRRQMPTSVRFLGRKVYLGVVVVLATAMQEGVSPPRASQLREALGVSRQTLERWRSWWRDSFGAGGFFKGLRGLLREPAAADQLPLSLLGAVGAPSIWEASRLVLQLLLPITSRTSPSSQAL